MRFHAPIALSALATVMAFSSQAEAKSRPAAGGLTLTEQLQMAQQQMAQMQAQLNAMQAKLDQTASAQSEALANNAAVMAKAETALATAAEAKTAASRPPAALKPLEWAAGTRLSGRMFFNVSSISQKTAGGANVASGTGFNIKRMFLGVDHKFNDTYAMNLTMDATNVVGSASNGNFNAAANPALIGKGFFIKNAFLEARINPALVVRLGSAQLPWVPYVESQYGLRHIENEGVERLGFGTSADWGIHVSGDLADRLISYQISVINGAGFRNVKITKSVDVEGRVSIQKNGFWGAVGGYVGKLGNNVQSTTTTPSTFRTAKRYNVAAGFKNADFGIGGEWFYAKNWRNVAVNPATNAVNQDSAMGYSVFANYNINPKWMVFSRYDSVQPNRTTFPGLRDNYFNVGIQWEPTRIVDLALVYKRDRVSNGSAATSNGVIGCGNAATPNSFVNLASATTCAGGGSYDEFGIFGLLRF